MANHTTIERSLKGKTTEALANLIFERGSYRVARVGIEELFREVKVINAEKYKQLGLDEALRTMPDLLVTDYNVSKAFQVEIKFRADFSGKTRCALADLLAEQRTHWRETYVIVMLGSCPGNNSTSFYQDFVRVIKPDFSLDDLKPKVLDSEIWNKLSDLRDVFVNLKNLKKSAFEIDALVPLLKTLKESSENKDA